MIQVSASNSHKDKGDEMEGAEVWVFQLLLLHDRQGWANKRSSQTHGGGDVGGSSLGQERGPDLKHHHFVVSRDSSCV